LRASCATCSRSACSRQSTWRSRMQPKIRQVRVQIRVCRSIQRHVEKRICNLSIVKIESCSKQKHSRDKCLKKWPMPRIAAGGDEQDTGDQETLTDGAPGRPDLGLGAPGPASAQGLKSWLQAESGQVRDWLLRGKQGIHNTAAHIFVTGRKAHSGEKCA
jgi:hypothetical protein